jgi:hypothetical protein
MRKSIFDILLISLCLVVLASVAFGEEAKIIRIPITENVGADILFALSQLKTEAEDTGCLIIFFGVKPHPNGKEVLICFVCAERNGKDI